MKINRNSLLSFFAIAWIFINCGQKHLDGKYMADVSKELDSIGLVVVFSFQGDSVTGYTSFIEGQDTSTEKAFAGVYKIEKNSVAIRYQDAAGENTFELVKRSNDTLVEKSTNSQIVYVKFE
ncbi:MAG: lipocalin family protein [bacterium]